MKHLNLNTWLVVLLIAAGCLWWFIKFPPTDSSSAAGWAQAFGTVGAILGSFAVIRYQIGNEATREKMASLERRISMLEIVLALTAIWPFLSSASLLS